MSEASVPGGHTRRTVIKAAAWAAPVVAVAVAAPLAAASTTAQPQPRARVIATLAGAVANGTRTVTFSNALVEYDADGSQLETGVITVTLPLFGNAPDFPLQVDEASWTDAGWTRIGNAGGNARFRHPSISAGSVPAGRATWSGAGDEYVFVAVGITVQTGGVGSTGVTYTYDPDDAVN
ncbi:MAG: hypothetical protein PGN24_02040 [Microbacterium arborescens]